MATPQHSSKRVTLRTTRNTKPCKLSSVKRTLRLTGSRLTQGSWKANLRSYWLTLASSATRHSRCSLPRMRRSANSRAAGISLHQENRSPRRKTPSIRASCSGRSLRSLIQIISRMCSSSTLSTRRMGTRRRPLPLRRSYSPYCLQTTRIWRA